MITWATLSFSFCFSTHHQKLSRNLVCVMKATSGRAPLLRMLDDCRVLSCQRRWHLIKDDRKQNEELKRVEFAPTFERDQIVKGVESGTYAGSSTTGDEPMEPLSRGLMNTMEETPYRVSWYDFQTVSPAKRFTYWVYRRLRDLPPEWQEYYRSMVYQEISASRYVNQTWDCFMMVVDGYRKAKWVLRKYGVKVDESLIPRPYNNFWEETTHEERVWAHRRSHQMKELQALQRDDDEAVFGASMMNRNEVSYTSIKNLQTGMQGGTPLHAHDLPAPKESELRMSRQDEEMSSALMSSIEDDKLWNPVLRSRLHTQRQRAEAELYGFEDEDDDGTAAEIQRK
ncbi:hypothetical protein, conserved [Leishmania donovani]|uniref:Uncharacterized protein n=2 Tax=Leishmania donovani TaxID=5661 RepID=E9BU93_LEIDO|nr:hypothetical protein, conserved [Leishmania donovani]AYU83740.1 hypothetical protein LdCL_360045500 [Leishmania donovani]CBZ38822.1 hypothetical protein, conserved [Leishmania donovani]